MAGVLVDDGIGHAVEQRRRVRRQLVADPGDRKLARPLSPPARPGCRGCRRRCCTARPARAFLPAARPPAARCGRSGPGPRWPAAAWCGCSAAITCSKPNRRSAWSRSAAAAHHDADAPRARPDERAQQRGGGAPAATLSMPTKCWRRAPGTSDTNDDDGVVRRRSSIAARTCGWSGAIDQTGVAAALQRAASCCASRSAGRIRPPSALNQRWPLLGQPGRHACTCWFSRATKLLFVPAARTMRRALRKRASRAAAGRAGSRAAHRRIAHARRCARARRRAAAARGRPWPG